MPYLDSLRADAVFGWRQIRKNKVTSAAAILSLALAIGACTFGVPAHRRVAASEWPLPDCSCIPRHSQIGIDPVPICRIVG